MKDRYRTGSGSDRDKDSIIIAIGNLVGNKYSCLRVSDLKLRTHVEFLSRSLPLPVLYQGHGVVACSC